jgi:hypothetical protein
MRHLSLVTNTTAKLHIRHTFVTNMSAVILIMHTLSNLLHFKLSENSCNLNYKIDKNRIPKESPTRQN